MGVSFFCVAGRGLRIYFSEKGKLVGFICEWQEESVCLKWKPYFFIIKNAKYVCQIGYYPYICIVIVL